MEFAIDNDAWKTYSDTIRLSALLSSKSVATIHFRWLETSETLDAIFDETKTKIKLVNFDSISNAGGLWLLSWVMVALRGGFPEKSIVATVSVELDLKETFQRAGFIFENRTTALFVSNHALHDDASSSFENIENTEFPIGRSILQEQYASYVWRHCHKEPTFWGLIQIATEIREYFQHKTVWKIKDRASLIPTSVAKRLLFVLNKILLISDDHMNNQPFSSVPQQYRQIYAIAAFEKGKIYLLQNKPLKALNILDDGIMKGIQFDDNNLSVFASTLCEKIIPPPPSLVSIDAIAILQPPKTLQWSKSIQTKTRPTLEFFHQHCVVDGKPLVIKDYLKDFPVFEFFDFNYLNNVHGHRLAPIEFGSYIGDDYSQQIISIHDYLVNYVFKETTPKAYLAQHALLDQLGLTNAIPEPYLASMLPNTNATETEPTMNVFIGPGGTLSPLHCDPRPNFFCQVRGQKFVRLVDRKNSHRVPINPEGMNTNSSIADFENPDYEMFPELVGLETEDVILNEGDCLFMPQKYFHLMRSLTPSISISYWC